MFEIRRSRTRSRSRGAQPGDVGATGLAYEIRDRAEPGLQELAILAGGLVFRWKVPAGLWESESRVHHLVEELPPRSRLLLGPQEPWDAGGCTAGDEERIVARFAARVQKGRVRLRLLGGRARGDYLLERLRAHPDRWTGRRLDDSSSPTG